jgi:hypothetical protein
MIASRTIAGTTLLASLLFATLSCGPGYHERGIVRGKVTFAGGGVAGATVAFTTSDNRNGVALTNEKGEYEMKDAPLGECTVTISSPKVSPEMRMMGSKMKMPEAPKGMSMPDQPEGAKEIPKLDFKKLKPLPDKYEKTETSGLKFTVQRGEQTYDIPLVP